MRTVILTLCDPSDDTYYESFIVKIPKGISVHTLENRIYKCVDAVKQKSPETFTWDDVIKEIQKTLPHICIEKVDEVKIYA